MKWQEVTFHCEFDNTYGSFAVSGKALLSGKVAPLLIGYVPMEVDLEEEDVEES